MAQAAQHPLEQIPPHDEPAEAGVLGSMLAAEEAATVAVEMLVAEDFYVPRYQLLFKLFRELYEQQPDLDLLYVQSELRRRGWVERVGGEGVIGALTERTPSPGNIERYCRLVRERAVERELLQSAGQILQMVQQPGSGQDVAGLVSKAEEIIYKISDRRSSQEPVSIHAVLEKVLEQAELHVAAHREGRKIDTGAIPTGFHDLDRMFAGGLWPGEVIIVAARPSVGKTTLSINIARKVACRPTERNPVGVGIFSLEMPKEQVSKNLLCAEARINSEKMRTYQFDDGDFEVVKDAAKQLGQAPIFIDDQPGITTTELRARARRLVHRENVKLLLIDYLQLMQTSRSMDSREQAVAELSRQVKHIARELKIPIILLSQLRRPPQGQEHKKPALTDLRESGSIEQDADVVLMLHRELDENNVMTRDVTAIVQKNRNGACGDVKLSFFPEQFRFETYMPELADAPSTVGV